MRFYEFGVVGNPTIHGEIMAHKELLVQELKAVMGR